MKIVFVLEISNNGGDRNAGYTIAKNDCPQRNVCAPKLRGSASERCKYDEVAGKVRRCYARLRSEKERKSTQVIEKPLRKTTKITRFSNCTNKFLQS